MSNNSTLYQSAQSPAATVTLQLKGKVLANTSTEVGPDIESLPNGLALSTSLYWIDSEGEGTVAE